MLFAVILLCAVEIQPAFCDERTAIKYEYLPNGSDTPMGCFHNAQVWASQHVFVAGQGRYVLIHCTQRSQGAPT